MNDEEEKKQGEGKGFAGLSSMVSDVDDVVSSKPKQPQKPHSEAPPKQTAGGSQQPKQTSTKPTSQTYQAPAQPSGGSSAGKWFLGIAVVIGLIWLANQSDNSRPSKPAYSPGTSSTSTAPASQPAIAQPQTPSRPSESKPSVGRNNVLSTAQIRYCLAEKIRLDAAETVLNNYNDSDVDRFNGYVNDYNSRCGEFRYRQGSLESARRDVNPYSSQLQAEGRSRFVRSPSTTVSPKPVRPTPDATVLAIQRRLKELGYDAGPADGLFGRKTRVAIQEFQRDNSLVVDGNANRSLLENLVKTIPREKSIPSPGRNRTPDTSGSSKSGLPENAKLDVYGSGWVCERGFYKSGGSCSPVQMPRNAKLDVYGSGWVCQRGYFKSNNECFAVRLPENAKLDVYGSGWVCERGFYKSGGSCSPVQMPRNAKLDVYGSGWVCQRGYFKSNNECFAVRLPENAKLDVYGSGWVCERGFYKSGGSCSPVQMPRNAKLDVYGSGWVCERGYRRSGDTCEPI